MSNFFGNKRLFVLLLSIIMLISLMGITLGERPDPSLPEKFVRDTTGFAQSLLYKPAREISQFFDHVQQMYRVYEENQILKANLDRLAQLSAEVKRLENDNRRLREMLDAKSRLNQYKLRMAEVVARSPDRWNNVLTIDLGSKDGIKAGMAVITPQGMIGRVQSVAHFSSQVELLSDIERGNYVSVIVQDNEEIYGILEGYDPKFNRLIMRKIPLGAEIKEKQTVVTSGWGGTIPPGIIIGEVTTVMPGEYGLTQIAYIRPSADFYRLHEVFVVEYYLPAEGTGQ